MITDNVRAIMEIFINAGFEIRIAGGAVRDHLLGLTPKDVDLATTAKPDQMCELAVKSGLTYVPLGFEFGTIAIKYNEDWFEVTTLRKDVDTDGRFAIVEFGASWEEDANRRDLTINSMYLDIDMNLYDYVGGKKDMDDKVIRLTGNADDRIKEDYLRIMRVVRFMSRYGWKTDSSTFMACLNNIDGLKGISGERIRVELLKIASGAHYINGLRYLDTMHFGRVFGYESLEDTVNDLYYMPSDCDPVLKLATVFIKTYEDGTPDISFFTDRLLMSKNEIRLIQLYYKMAKIPRISVFDIHSLIHIEKINPELIKKCICVIRHVNPDIVDNSVNQKLPVNGNDVKELGYSGTEIGDALRNAQMFWIKSNLNSSKEEILDHLKKQKSIAKTTILE